MRLAFAHRPRRGSFALRKVTIKEFLQAGHIADAVLRAGDVSHLHGHFCHGVATITWMASRMSGIPFSFTAHAKDIYQAELNPGRLLETKLGAADIHARRKSTPFITGSIPATLIVTPAAILQQQASAKPHHSSSRWAGLWRRRASISCWMPAPN
jgi:hypothetical protein